MGEMWLPSQIRLEQHALRLRVNVSFGEASGGVAPNVKPVQPTAAKSGLCLCDQ
jgi:hypothetical protein